MVKSRGDLIFDAIVAVLLAAAAVAAIFPLMYVFSVSVTPYGEVLKNGGFVLIPKAVTFEAYRYLFDNPAIPRSFSISLFVTVVGTLINLLLTVTMAYPLSRRLLRGRSLILFLIVFTMLFNGGLIPTYLAVQKVGLLNSVWSMIIPSAIATFNLLIIKTFFEGLPPELNESARMDGAGEVRIMWQIAVPLSLPALMTVGLFYMVSNWNQFFAAIMYIQDKDLMPLQIVVREILLSTQRQEMNVDEVLPTATLQMAAVIVASVPIIVVYPFIQKHFSKGMLIGAVKG